MKVSPCRECEYQLNTVSCKSQITSEACNSQHALKETLFISFTKNSTQRNKLFLQHRGTVFIKKKCECRSNYEHFKEPLFKKNIYFLFFEIYSLFSPN